MPAVVTQEKCSGCAECVDTCPCEAITLVEAKANVDEDKCSDCSACVDACPNGAINVD